MALSKFSVHPILCNWRTNEWRFSLIAYNGAGVNFPTESIESWATKAEAEAVCARVNAGDETGVKFASYADD